MNTLLVCLSLIVAAGAAVEETNIPIDGFYDGIRHYQSVRDSKDYPRYGESQFREIAENILLQQRANGGWTSNWDPLRILDPGERQAALQDRDKQDTSFDNHCTYTQVVYLASAFERSGETRFRDGALAGLEFILSAQYDIGGWPHSFPRESGYQRRITIMDDVMTGILSTLRDAASGKPPFAFLDDALRARVNEAVLRGNDCLLRAQVRVDGVPTVWAGQYDEITLEPAQGRSFELPGLVSAESVNVVRYLMELSPQTPEIDQAIESAAAWFESSKITGMRVERIAKDPVRYQYHTAEQDVVVVPDPEAPPIWARFYEIGTNRPFMANRDGGKVYTLAEVEHERRTGYAWYTGAPTDLLEKEYPQWKKHRGAGDR